MAGDLAQLVKDGYDAWNRGDRDWVLAHMSPDFEWISPADDPDAGVYRGYEAVEHYWEGWREAVGELHFEVERIEERGDEVVVVARRSGRGIESGLVIEDSIVQIFTFDGSGKAVSCREFYDESEALKEVRRSAES
ncbi:MAG: nuclear transport factor 2 family protein [Thermoleophilaceae bacterium]|nr:nuclear transport factor 2 family protein [Thermoleophilaceae bacterium]